MTIVQIDGESPLFWIAEPTDGQVLNHFVIGGACSDNDQVKHARIVIQDLDTQKYFDGNEWQTDWTYFTVEANYDGLWIYSKHHLQGNFMLSSRAVDQAGNVEKPPALVRCQVTN